MLQCLVAFGDQGPLQVEGGDKTPTAASAAQGGKMPLDKKTQQTNHIVQLLVTN